MKPLHRKSSRVVVACQVEMLERRALLSALNPSTLIPVGNRLFFLGEDSTHGRELWVSDGTPIGTRMVKDILPGAGTSNIHGLTPFGNRVAFAADDGSHGRELWLSDGTSAGTFLVKDILGGSQEGFPIGIKTVGNLMYFSAGTSQYGRELWKSDGTEAGTVFIKDIYQGNIGSGSGGFTEVNGTVFFSAEGMVTSGQGHHTITTYFGRELWKTDGTAAGTVMVRDINPDYSDSGPDQLTNVNGTLFFTAHTSEFGTEMWKSDGTTAGTVLVRDIGTTFRGSYPFGLRAHENAAFFNAIDDFEHYLWRSDGTTAGTTIVSDFAPGFSGLVPANFIPINQTDFFAGFGDSGGVEIWRTDQTPTGSIFLGFAIPPEVHQQNPYLGSLQARSGQLLFFTAFKSGTGMELHVTDGTLAGTRMVKDIFPGASQFNPSPSDLTDMNGKLFFVADNGSNGRELWMSNGTAPGTRMVRFGLDGPVKHPTLNTNATRAPAAVTFSSSTLGLLLDGLEDQTELAS